MIRATPVMINRNFLTSLIFTLSLKSVWPIKLYQSFCRYEVYTTPFIGGKFYIPGLCFRVISGFIISNSFQKLTFTSFPNGTSNDVEKKH